MSLPEPQGALAAHGVIYRPPGLDRLVLQGVSLQLAPGASLAIVGPSAAGKSTLARVLTGLWKPTAGIVRLDGADLSIWPRETLGPSIGYLPQDVELFQGTVAENIARLGPVDSEDVVNAARRAHAHDMILSLPQGYDTPVDSAGVQLSPGSTPADRAGARALRQSAAGDPGRTKFQSGRSRRAGACGRDLRPAKAVGDRGGRDAPPIADTAHVPHARSGGRPRPAVRADNPGAGCARPAEERHDGGECRPAIAPGSA